MNGDAPPADRAPDAAVSPPSELHFLDPRRWRSHYAEVDAEVWVVCIIAAVALTLHEMVFLAKDAVAGFRFIAPEWTHRVFEVDKPAWRGLARYLWWVGGTTFSWVVLPWIGAWIVCRRFPRDYGLVATPPRKLGPYAVMLGAMVPVVFIAALWLPGFAQQYPLYDAGPAGWTWRYLLIYELAYGFQFFAAESFFRGWLCVGLSRSLGYRAVLVAMPPYVMVHFHKPMLEALAAIIAGLILGSFAVRTRSIWGGLLVHLGVAWSMDFASIAVGGARGGFPTEW
jgi:hypothetical protein